VARDWVHLGPPGAPNFGACKAGEYMLRCNNNLGNLQGWRIHVALQEIERWVHIFGIEKNALLLF